MTKYLISAVPQTTPFPTPAPSAAVGDGDGLDVRSGDSAEEVRKMDAGNVIQICFAAGALFLALLGAFVSSAKKQSEKTVYQHPLLTTVFVFGTLGLELTSMVFVMAKMSAYGATANAAALGALRLVHIVAGLVIVQCVMGSESMMSWGKLTDLLDKDHMNHSHLLYLLLALLCPWMCASWSFCPGRSPCSPPSAAATPPSGCGTRCAL